MRVVIDTNVLVSAALKDRNPERVILFVVERPEIEWLVSREILAEYSEVLSRPGFKLPEEILSKWIDLLARATTLVEVEDVVEFPRDRKDAKFLECAISADADYLVTGDRDFQSAGKMLGTVIVSVSMFGRLVCGLS